MTIVITGANGAVGMALVRLLCTEPGPDAHRVRALVRRPAEAQALQALGAEVVGIDYQQPAVVRAAVAGAAAVVHLAGALLPHRAEALWQANVLTTQAIATAAAEAGVKTLVYLSFPGANATASNIYLRSKGLAEAAIQQSGCGGMIWRVPMILGAGSPALAHLQRLARAPLLPLVRGGAMRLQPIAQADVVAAVAWTLRAAPTPLRIVNLVGPETLTYAALLRQVGARLGTRPRVIPLPPTAVRLSAVLAETLCPRLGWNRSLYDILFREHLVDATAAQALLPFALTPVAVLLDQALGGQA